MTQPQIEINSHQDAIVPDYFQYQSGWAQGTTYEFAEYTVQVAISIDMSPGQSSSVINGRGCVRELG